MTTIITLQKSDRKLSTRKYPIDRLLENQGFYVGARQAKSAGVSCAILRRAKPWLNFHVNKVSDEIYLVSRGTDLRPFFVYKR